MPEIGQPSHFLDEEEFIDIPVDTEQLIGYAPIAPIQSEAEEAEAEEAEEAEAEEAEEAEAEEAEEAEADEAEEAAETDPEENPEDLAVEPVGYHDDMWTTSDDIIEELTTHSVQLEDRITHLEEQNAVHQEMENQYRDLAYLKEAESAELRQQLHQLQQNRAADSQQVLELAEHQAHAEASADRLRAERDVARIELQILGDDWSQLRDDRDIFLDAWQLTVARVRELEEEVRTSTIRTETARFALDTAFSRLRSRVRRYPREEDMSRRAIPRRIVDFIARQELEGAILRRGV